MRRDLHERADEGSFVEGVEFSFAELVANALEAVPEIILVAIEKAFALKKIAKHEAVQHEGGVGILEPAVGDAIDELLERVLLCLELVVEFSW